MLASSASTFKPSTLVHLLRHRAQDQPDFRAITFLGDGETEEGHLTYGELDRRARALGAWLQEREGQGQRVLLLPPQGLDYVAAFFGCLYAGALPVPTYPPQSSRPLTRLQALAADARPIAAFTTKTVLTQASHRFAEVPELEVLRWLTPEDLPAGIEEAWRDPEVTAETLAFVQYSSGSTSTPKGVVVNHGNILYNERLLEHCSSHDADAVMVSWLPLHHDMGLNMKVLQALYMGLPLVLMSPTNFIQKPIRWLTAMTRYRGTASGGPGFAYDLCVRRVTPAQKATLDLRAWRSAYIGAEPVRAVTLDRFAEAFAECGFQRDAFYPCYGLAEATLIVSGGRREEPPVVGRFDAEGLEAGQIIPVTEDAPNSRQVVGCGQSLPGQTVRIADPETRAECPPGKMGEVWMEGPSVAQGYWERPEETREVFHAYLSDTGEGPFLRTGDLGFLRDGELYIAGRLKDLIIIAGSNYYPPDIEQAVEEAHPALRPAGAAAFLAEVEGEERLVVAVEVDRSYRPRRVHGDENGHSNGATPPSFDRMEVTNAVRRAVTERHDVLVHTLVFLQHGTLNKTSSGKIQRQACRRDFLADTLQRIDW